MATVTQRAFAAGEVCPALYSRVDQVRYATGLRTCRNFLVERAGGVSSRPGTERIAQVNTDTTLAKKVRLIPFVYNDDQTYVLEFGENYIRVYNAGAPLTYTPKTIATASQAATCQLGVTTHGYSTGDNVLVDGCVGMPELNNREFSVASAGASLLNLTGVNSTTYGAYTASSGTVAKIYSITTTYTSAELADLKYTQSADVMTLTHPSHPVMELSRTAHTSWTLAAAVFETDIGRPTAVAGATAGAATYRYRVTQVSKGTLEESLPCYDGSFLIDSGSAASPVEITLSGPHTYTTGDEVYFSSVIGMTQLNGNSYIITTTGPNSFTLDGVNGTAYSPATYGIAKRTYLRADSATFPIGISCVGTEDALEFNVYREQYGVYGYVGTVPAAPWTPTVSRGTFTDTGYTPDLTDNPPIDRIVFASATNYPSCVTYHQQRLILANTTSDVEGVWGSMTGLYHNFCYHSPLHDDDSFMFRLAGLKVNAVQNVLGMKNLILFTDGGVWVAQGNSSGIITPSEINAVQHSYHGAASLHPIIVGESVLYVQSRGSIIRDLAYDYQVDGYRGNDLTTFSTHMVDGFELNEWAYQETPNSIVWVVRDDGTLLGITYIKEQQIIGWSHHDFGDGGTVESVCCVPEGNEDALYMVVRRPVPGTTDERYVERMATRQVDDIKDYIGLDCTMTYDGNNTGSGTMTVTSGTTWTHDELLTINSSLSYFASGDVGNEIHLTGSDGETLRFAITQYSSATQVKGHGHKTVPTSLRSTATLVWAKAVDEVAGLWPHRGKSVAVFADGFVVANPNNASYATATVSALGSLTLPGHYAFVRVGLPITHDLETLDVDTEQGETMQDKRKLITKVVVMVRQSMDFWAGPKPPSDDATDNLEGLTEAKIRIDESYDDPVALKTGAAEVIIGGEWSQGGRVFLRQIDPVPLSIMAVSPSGLIPFRGGK